MRSKDGGAQHVIARDVRMMRSGPTPSHHSSYRAILALFTALLIGGASVQAASALPLPSAGTPEAGADIEDDTPIATDMAAARDDAIADRLRAIFAELDALSGVNVAVRSGVVTLTGAVSGAEDVDRAINIARRVEGVVTVDNAIAPPDAVSANLSPAFQRLRDRLSETWQMLPLLGLALAIMAIFWLLARALASADWLWRRISPNRFLVDLLSTTARLVIVMTGLIIALDLLGATTLLGAILGSAGLVGLAIGFAMKDTVDNYVSSLMLSIRQPFRANDLVVIGDREGRVIRLTSRATILMTLDGNHLRIPNSTVFMAEILNFTRNPERRFDFVLGVDANDDPGEAMETGLACMRDLPFLLDEPAPSARLEEIGDSNIQLRFLGWIDQSNTDWYKARSATIRAVKIVLEAEGFGLPEPIYRLRFDTDNPLEIRQGAVLPAPASPDRPRTQPKAAGTLRDMDVGLEDEIKEKVQQERAASSEEDILDHQRPIE